MKIHEFDGEISVKNTNMDYEMVQCYDITKANEGLGLSERLHHSSLNQKEAYIGSNRTIFKKIEYILPGTSFTEAQCRILERALYRHLMGKLGLTTKFPLA